MDWLETLIFAILATIKFAVAVPFFILEERLSFWEGLLFSLSSGTFGIILFMFISRWIIRGWSRLKRALGFSGTPRKRKKFSRRSRRLVRIKSRYGLIGIALLSPIFLSIPVGCFLAVRYYKNTRRVFLYMEAGVILWSLIFATSASLIIQLLKSLQLALA